MRLPLHVLFTLPNVKSPAGEGSVRGAIATRQYGLPEDIEEYLAFRKTKYSEAPPDEPTSSGIPTNPFVVGLSLVPKPQKVKDYTEYKHTDYLNYKEMMDLGYRDLADQIMSNGGINEAYKLVGRHAPITKQEVRQPIVFDVDGSLQATYKGLKLGAEAENEEQRLSEEVRMGKVKGKPVELPESMIPTFKNLPPSQTPAQTAEDLDRVGRATGKSMSWARSMKRKNIESRYGEPGDIVIPGTNGIVFDFVRQMYFAAYIFFLGLGFGKSSGGMSEYLHNDFAADAVITTGRVILLALISAAASGALKEASSGASKKRVCMYALTGPWGRQVPVGKDDVEG